MHLKNLSFKNIFKLQTFIAKQVISCNIKENVVSWSHSFEKKVSSFVLNCHLSKFNLTEKHFLRKFKQIFRENTKLQK